MFVSGRKIIFLRFVPHKNPCGCDRTHYTPPPTAATGSIDSDHLSSTYGRSGNGQVTNLSIDLIFICFDLQNFFERKLSKGTMFARLASHVYPHKKFGFLFLYTINLYYYTPIHVPDTKGGQK